MDKELAQQIANELGEVAARLQDVQRLLPQTDTVNVNSLTVCYNGISDVQARYRDIATS